MGPDQELIAETGALVIAITQQLDDLREFVDWVARDYVELSHDKVRLQRDEYQRKANELKAKYAINLPPPYEPTPLNDNF